METQVSTNTRGRSRRFCYTLNNPKEDEVTILRGIDAAYHIFAFEVGKLGTLHVQGYLEYTNARSLTAIKHDLCGRAHIEIAKGARKHNIEYITKDPRNFEGEPDPTSVFERGDRRSDGGRDNFGKRRDLAFIKEAVLEKQIPLVDIVHNSCNNFQQVKFAETLQKYIKPAFREAPIVKWFWGKTGTGKTYTAHKESEGKEVWLSNSGIQWFDGYSGQEVAILDDLRCDPKDWSMLLRILDRYHIRVPIKGGFVNWTPNIIYVTCPYEPNYFPAGAHEDINQLIRRITEIRFFCDIDFRPTSPISLICNNEVYDPTCDDFLEIVHSSDDE